MRFLKALFCFLSIATCTIIIGVPYGLEPASTCRYYGYGDVIGSTQNISQLYNQLISQNIPSAYLAAYNGDFSGSVLTNTGAIQPYNKYTNPTNYVFCEYSRGGTGKDNKLMQGAEEIYGVGNLNYVPERPNGVFTGDYDWLFRQAPPPATLKSKKRRPLVLQSGPKDEQLYTTNKYADPLCVYCDGQNPPRTLVSQCEELYRSPVTLEELHKEFPHLRNNEYESHIKIINTDKVESSFAKDIRTREKNQKLFGIVKKDTLSDSYESSVSEYGKDMRKNNKLMGKGIKKKRH